MRIGLVERHQVFDRSFPLLQPLLPIEKGVGADLTPRCLLPENDCGRSARLTFKLMVAWRGVRVESFFVGVREVRDRQAMLRYRNATCPTQR